MGSSLAAGSRRAGLIMIGSFSCAVLLEFALSLTNFELYSLALSNTRFVGFANQAERCARPCSGRRSNTFYVVIVGGPGDRALARLAMLLNCGSP